MRLLKLLLLLCVCAAGPAVAEPFEDAVAAFREGDYATAIRLWRPLADNGDARAQTSLAVLFDRGWGVSQDHAAAVSWYRKAADQGEAHAQNNLGIRYEQGLSVPQDYAQAHMWFNLAAANLPGKEDRDIAGRNLDRVAAKMTPAQIAEAQKLAREWKPKPER